MVAGLIWGSTASLWWGKLAVRMGSAFEIRSSEEAGYSSRRGQRARWENRRVPVHVRLFNDLSCDWGKWGTESFNAQLTRLCWEKKPNQKNKVHTCLKSLQDFRRPPDGAVCSCPFWSTPALIHKSYFMLFQNYFHQEWLKPACLTQALELSSYVNIFVSASR